MRKLPESVTCDRAKFEADAANGRGDRAYDQQLDDKSQRQDDRQQCECEDRIDDGSTTSIALLYSVRMRIVIRQRDDDGSWAVDDATQFLGDQLKGHFPDRNSAWKWAVSNYPEAQIIVEGERKNDDGLSRPS